MASTSRLVTALKFKNLNSQLTDEEFNCFVSKLWRAIGREELVQLLSTSSLKSSDQTPLNIMSGITSDIIRNRNTKDMTDQDSTISICTMLQNDGSHAHIWVIEVTTQDLG